MTIINVAIRQLGDAFERSVTGLQWVVDAYTIVFASLISTAGVLADRIGAQRVFIVGFAIFPLASMGCAAAPNLLAPLLLIGAGLGLVVAPMMTAVLRAVERTQSGAVNATRQTGSLIGVALYGSLIAD